MDGVINKCCIVIENSTSHMNTNGFKIQNVTKSFKILINEKIT